MRRSYGYGENEIELMNIFRKLWEEHVMWTRSFIISTAADLGDKDLVAKRLLQNPGDFANVLRQFYGAEKADNFKRLFEQHLLIAADLVNAAKAGDAAAVDEARKKWYGNADEIAGFLSDINPFWGKNEWQAMLYDHLRMTENEAVMRLTGQYAEDIEQYEAIQNEALKMADYMSERIIRQFRF